MNKSILTSLAAALCLLGLSGSLRAQTYNSADTPTAPYQPTSVSTINVPAGPPSGILDVNIDISFSADHGFDRRYDATITSPNGTTVVLFDMANPFSTAGGQGPGRSAANTRMLIMVTLNLRR